LSGARFYALNSPKIVCQPGSSRTRWGSLQRFSRPPSWITGKGGERGDRRTGGEGREREGRDRGEEEKRKEEGGRKGRREESPCECKS